VPRLTRKPRVLVVAREYPTVAAPTRGLWARRIVHASTAVADPTVIVPTSWVPPGMPFTWLAKLRDIPSQTRDADVDVYFPRVFGSVGYLTHGFDADLAYPPVKRLADSLHERAPFDLIHAHFIYPEGVIAAWLGARYGIPVLTTEHSFWLPWLRDEARAGRLVDQALPGIRLVTTVSESLRGAVGDYLQGRVATAILPNVVDDAIFTRRETGEPRDRNQMLFVGLVRRVKGLDVLTRAFRTLADAYPALHLLVIGSAYRRAYQREVDEALGLIQQLGLSSRTRFVANAPADVVACAMRQSGIVVIPSRRETFCSVAAEALASGTPVVVTRCGGPEEFVTAADGLLVANEDPAALADGIVTTLARLDEFDGPAMRERIVDRFGMAAVSARIGEIYAGLLA
jgi:glycosyltransferase involved in cell wall biosynthesis